MDKRRTQCSCVIGNMFVQVRSTGREWFLDMVIIVVVVDVVASVCLDNGVVVVMYNIWTWRLMSLLALMQLLAQCT